MKLDNGIVRFEFDECTGSLAQISDLRSGRTYLDDPRGNRLVKLIVPAEEHNSRPLYSHEAGRPAVTKTGNTLAIAFPEMRYRGRKTGVLITVKARLPEGSPEAFFSIAMNNRSPYRVHEMWFPWIGGRRCAADTKDIVTTTKGRGYNPYQSMKRGAEETHTFGRHTRRRGGDGMCRLPMADLSDGQGGISYIKYEKRPSPHIFVLEDVSDGCEESALTMAWATGVFVEPGATWTSCEFGVGVHQGDWHETAERLRRWVEGWWCPCDTPREVREKIGLLHVQMHGFSGEPYHEFSEMPAFARDSMKYGVNDLMIWDYTASVYYRPDQGDFWEMPPKRLSELKRSLAAVRRMGCSVSAFVNWRLASTYNKSWKYMKPLVQESLFGQGMYGFPSGTMDGGWYNDCAYEQGSWSVCCGADKFRPFATKLLDRTLDLGFDAIAVDQAAEWNYCLSKRHGHASPWEAWERTYEWFGEATRRTRGRNRTAYTIGEIPDLYNCQHIDLWWVWSYRGHSGVRPDIMRYVMPTMIPCWCIDENQMPAIAEAFAMGSFMAIATRDMTGSLSDAPGLAAQVARLAKLRKATAPFVAHGRYMDDRGLAVEGGFGVAYKSEHGIAVALANGSARKARLKVTLRPEELGVGAPGDCLLHAEGARPARITPGRRGAELRFEVALPAYQAGVLTLARA